MHQYYESRIAPDGASSVDGQPFQQLSRADFPAPAGPRWYVCMQKPFKFTPAFDRMLAAVHARDPEGVILLHEIQARYVPCSRACRLAREIYYERRQAACACACGM